MAICGCKVNTHELMTHTHTAAAGDLRSTANPSEYRALGRIVGIQLNDPCACVRAARLWRPSIVRIEHPNTHTHTQAHTPSAKCAAASANWQASINYNLSHKQRSHRTTSERSFAVVVIRSTHTRSIRLSHLRTRAGTWSINSLYHNTNTTICHVTFNTHSIYTIH